MNENLRVRIHIVGVVVTALFCSLFARLWFLQVNESPTELNIASESLRTIRTASTRGLIFDSRGRVLVGNRISWSILADPSLRMVKGDSPSHKAEVQQHRAEVVPKLSALLAVDRGVLEKRLNNELLGPLEPVVIWADLAVDKRTQLAEHADQYPRVSLTPLALRYYAYPSTAPQTLGYLGIVNSKDVAKHPNYGTNDLIGRDGIEAAYESVLRGEPSSLDVRVTPAGRVIDGAPENVNPGRSGDNIHLTLDEQLQNFAQDALQRGIEKARSKRDEDLKVFGLSDKYRATGGAVVVLDTRNGDIKTMASSPNYASSDNVIQNFKQLSSPDNHIPLLNRPASGLYSPGSTFKLITSLAMDETGVRSPTDFYDDQRCYKRKGIPDKCAIVGADLVNLSMAVTVSADSYFYSVGDELWLKWFHGDKLNGYAIQNKAREFGFGAKTDVEVGESAGTIPDDAWKKEIVKKLYPKNLQASYNQWQPGDSISLAVGQGDLLVTPLQLANAYSAFANGGDLWRPRLVSRVEDSSGKTVAGAPRPLRLNKITIPEVVRQSLLNGFQGVVADKSGTASDAFKDFPASLGVVRGKTGTAQVGKSKAQPGPGVESCITQGANGIDTKQCIGDTSWFVGMYSPPGTDTDHPQYIVLAMVEEGGRGGQIAAPVVRQIIEHMAGLPDAQITPIPDLTSSLTSTGRKG